jgi:hypothetical protein
MQFFLFDILDKIQNLGRKLDDLSLLKNNHWVQLNEIDKTKKVFIFRSNNELLISNNGLIKKHKWEYLGNGSLLIEMDEGSFLFKCGFLDKTLLALKIDSSNNFVVFINETKFGKEINNSTDLSNYLKREYLLKNEQPQRNKQSNNINRTSNTSYTKRSKPSNVVYVENICPACNFKGVRDLSKCPGCGIHFG